jgi:hypothetical protein
MIRTKRGHQITRSTGVGWENHTAYFPIEIGIGFSRNCFPEIWNFAEQEVFWEGLYAHCDDLIERERQAGGRLSGGWR